MVTITGAAIGTAAAAITPAQSSTTTRSMSPTTMCTRDDLPARATLDIVHQPRDTHDLDILPGRCLIRRPSRLTTVPVDTIVRTTVLFRPRGHITPQPRSRMLQTIPT